MISRRKFIQAGTVIAIAAGVPLKTAMVVPGKRSSAPQTGSPGVTTATAPPATKSDTFSFYTKASFAAHLNSPFIIKSKRSRAAEIKLIKVSDAGPVPDRPSAGRECFALLFVGHQTFQQDVYTFEHASLGKFDLLLVPVGKDKKGSYYEALINRLN